MHAIEVVPVLEHWPESAGILRGRGRGRGPAVGSCFLSFSGVTGERALLERSLSFFCVLGAAVAAKGGAILVHGHFALGLFYSAFQQILDFRYSLLAAGVLSEFNEFQLLVL